MTEIEIPELLSEGWAPKLNMALAELDYRSKTNADAAQDAMDTANDALAASVTIFRGPYTDAEQVKVYNFADGLMPPEFTFFKSADYSPANATIDAGNGDASQPPGKSILIRQLSGGTNAGIQFTVPAGVTKLRWKWNTNNGGGGIYTWWAVDKNGGEVTTMRTNDVVWREQVIPVAPGDVIKFRANDSGNWGATYRLGFIEFLVEAAPYKTGQVVSHLGKLWRSTTESNPSVPGADTNWTVLIDPIPATVDIKNIVKITQAAYDALATKVATTLYVIVG